jgi:hypothetical protein
MKRILPGIVLLFLSGTVLAEPAGFARHVQPFFEQYCLRCHNEKQQKGAFRLDTLPRDFTSQLIVQRWAEVLFRINSGEMPPKKEPQPKAEDLGRVAEWISARIREGEAERMAKRGPVAHYRLSKEEYGHTVYDLLGVYFDVNLPGAFNDEPRWHGFERIGSQLTLSPSHVDRYLKAADTVVARAFPSKPIAVTKGQRDANMGHEKWLQEKGWTGRVRWLLWPGRTHQLFTASSPGLYRVRIQLSALPSFRGRLPSLALWHHGLKRSIVGREVCADEDNPTSIELEAFLPEGVYSIVNEAPGMLADGQTTPLSTITFVSTKLTRPERPTTYRLFTDDDKPIFPLLLVDALDWEGPLQVETDVKKREGMFPSNLAPPEEVRTCLTRFAERAWRRPTTAAEIEPYLKIVETERKAGEPLPDAYRSALVAMLSSKNFFYLEEGEAIRRRDKVNPWELASRLSYFLWSSMPDEELSAAARSGTLVKPEMLGAQLARMSKDRKIERFTESFPRQWLQLHRVGMFPPDPELYPDYDKWLERSMVLETTEFFAAVFRNDLTLREFLDSNWTMMNARLALHYGLPTPKEAGWQKVTLPPDTHRGGLLTHASVLSLTSDGTRHRPVHRGVWLSEAIFARTPPPPPPNVEPLEPTPSNKPKATIRMQLEAHVTHATCASCHRKIDPLGFAFDNFDAIGRWRTEEMVLGGQGANPNVDARGTLADGRAFDGPEQFRRLLADDLDRFAEAFTEQLATYALRRAMTIDDAPKIRAIAEASKKTGYRLRAVLENLVLSELFQQR